LRHAQKMEALGRLAGGVAHDFSNFLTVILASADALAEHLEGDAEGLIWTEDIREVAQRATVVTRQLLAVGRRQFTEQPKMADLGEAVEESTHTLRTLLPPSIELAVQRPNEPAPIEADAEQLQQILMNLATNARDAMPHGGLLELRVETPPLRARLDPL